MLWLSSSCRRWWREHLEPRKVFRCSVKQVSLVLSICSLLSSLCWPALTRYLLDNYVSGEHVVHLESWISLFFLRPKSIILKTGRSWLCIPFVLERQRAGSFWRSSLPRPPNLRLARVVRWELHILLGCLRLGKIAQGRPWPVSLPHSLVRFLLGFLWSWKPHPLIWSTRSTKVFLPCQGSRNPMASWCSWWWPWELCQRRDPFPRLSFTRENLLGEYLYCIIWDAHPEWGSRWNL